MVDASDSFNDYSVHELLTLLVCWLLRLWCWLLRSRCCSCCGSCCGRSSCSCGCCRSDVYQTAFIQTSAEGSRLFIIVDILNCVAALLLIFVICDEDSQCFSLFALNSYVYRTTCNRLAAADLLCVCNVAVVVDID